jgi:uncharacterized protein (DUF4415 family)
MRKNTITRMSIEEIRRLKGETDWERLKREDEGGVEPEPDADEFEVDWSKARLVIPEPKTPVTIRLDPDVLAFFRAGGRGYQTRINAVLRAFMEAHRSGRQAP